MRFDLDSVFGVHEKAVMLRSQRALVLAENLANADTPNFKAKDIDFKSALNNAKNGVDAASMRATNPKHFGSGTVDGSLSPELIERQANQPSLDGNTVDSQIEQSAFLRNAIEYQTSLRLLSGKIKGLMSAIKGE